MSVLGLNSGYTVKYNPLLSGTPSGKGLYWTVYPLSRPNTDTVWTHLNGAYGTIRSHIRFHTESAPTRCPQLGISAEPLPLCIKK